MDRYYGRCGQIFSFHGDRYTARRIRQPFFFISNENKIGNQVGKELFFILMLIRLYYSYTAITVSGTKRQKLMTPF
jgi:hypothetical protein